MTFHCYFLRRGYRVGSHDVFSFCVLSVFLWIIYAFLRKCYKIYDFNAYIFVCLYIPLLHYLTTDSESFIYLSQHCLPISLI